MVYRIAILADIHGNLAALQAVQHDLASLAPDHVVVDGDVVNRGPQSQECVQAVRAAGWPTTFGNHEELMLKLADDEVPDEWRSEWWQPSWHAAQSLSEDEIKFIRALPWDHVIEVPGLPALRVVHGSMRALNDGIGFWMSDDELRDALRSAPEPIVVGAHTHRPFQRRVGERWALNCGAVGVPFNGNPYAQYLVFYGEDGRWRAEFRSVPYDRGAVYAAWARTSYYAESAAAHVFEYEVQSATFHLGAYESFCRQHGLPKTDLASFEQYRRRTRDLLPGRSLHHAPPHDMRHPT